MNYKQHMNHKQKSARARIKKIMITTGLVVGISAIGVTDIIQPLTQHMTTTVQASEITDFTYKVVDGTVTITGYNGGPVVTIPAEIDGLPVTRIGDNAFERKGLTEVHFEGENLTYIGYNAFTENNLTEFHMPNSVTSTGSYIISGNKNIETLTVSSGLKSIGGNTFRFAGIKNVVIPEGVETIGIYAFYENQLTEVTIPSTVSNIEDSAFATNKIANAYFVGDRTVIAYNAFQSNSGIIINAPDPSTAKQHAEARGYLYMPWAAPEPEPEPEPEAPVLNPGEAGSSTGKATEDGYVQENDLSANIMGGGLLLGNIDITNFGDIAITDKAETYFASINNPLNVKDLRGNQEGWELSVSATAMASENHALPNGSLTLDGVDTITSGSASAENIPVKKLVDRTIIDDGSVLIAKAEKGTGAGEFDIAFKENAIGLTVDPQTAKTGEYHSTMTWTLASTPTSGN